MLLTLTKMLIVKNAVYVGFPNFWGRLQELINKKDHYYT